jgi:molybdate/tungstate transport system ATP-binding protein
MIEIQKLSIKAGQFEVKECSLQLAQGKIHVLIGPSGSGKTLLLETIVGIRKADQGSITLLNKTITHEAPEKRRLAYMPQDYALFPHLNVHQNIAFGLQFADKLSIKEKDEKIDKLASLLDITHLLKRGVKGLSGGEKQRVALARALAVDKPILLMDEPFSSLQESMAESLSVLLLDIMKSMDLTILMTTHQRDHAYILADYIHLMSDGVLYQSIAKPYLHKVPIRKEIAGLLGINNTMSVEFEPSMNKNFAISADLQGKVELPNFSYPVQNQHCILGIHPIDVILFKELTGVPQNTPNTFIMVVERVLQKEQTQLFLLRHPKSGYLLKAERPLLDPHSERIEEGDRVHVQLPIGSIKLLV